jgi:MFS family permease
MRGTSPGGITADQESRRNIRIYLVGFAASLIGNSAMTLVAGIWVKSLTGSDSAAALVAVCVYAPSAFGPLAGMVADRVRRRRLLVLVNLASAVTMLPLLFVRSTDEIWLIYVVMFGYGISLVLIGPAESALFANMLPVQVRQQMNGVLLALQEGGKLVAPLVGAGLFVVLGGGVVAALDSATFVVAVIALLRLRFKEPPPQPTERHWWTEMVSGFRYIRHHAALRATVVAGAIAMIISGIATAAQYALADALHRPPSFLGALTSALGAGSIIAGVTSGRLITRIGEVRLALLGLLNGVLGSILRMTGTTPTALLGSFVLGFALPWSVVAVINLAQRTAPNALQGRVSAAITLALFAPQPLAQTVGAAAVGHLDYRTIYLITAALTLGTAIWLGRSWKTR